MAKRWKLKNRPRPTFPKGAIAAAARVTPAGPLPADDVLARLLAEPFVEAEGGPVFTTDADVDDKPCPECNAGWPSWDPAWAPECKACGYIDVDEMRRQNEEDALAS
jgi:hypothetical protein